MSTRTPLVAANWKMHCDQKETRALIRLLRDDLRHAPRVDVVVAPPFTALVTAAEELRGSAIGLGAQNCYCEERGAFTGEIAPMMLVDLGVQYVILGHSERRYIFQETAELINRKVRAALSAGLRPILCVGETLTERDGGRTMQVVTSEVRAGLQGVDPDAMGSVIIAYEPLWAIGTGRNATPAQAQEVHAAIRGQLRALYSPAVAEATRILYGGSVKADNAHTIFSEPDVDGGLVGGASLKAESFLPIVHAARVAR